MIALWICGSIALYIAGVGFACGLQTGSNREANDDEVWFSFLWPIMLPITIIGGGANILGAAITNYREAREKKRLLEENKLKQAIAELDSELNANQLPAHHE
jgi:hypothetical protein